MAAIVEPIGRSVLYHYHRSLGAAITDHFGWVTATQFTSPEEEERGVLENVGLADVSWLRTWDVKGEVSLPQPPISNPKMVWKLARGHWLVMCDPHEVATVCEELERGSEATDCYHVTDVTSVYTALLLAGPQAKVVLNKLTALDLSEAEMPNLRCAQTGLAHVHAIVLRKDLVEVPSYRLFVGREHGEYIWDAVIEAGCEFGIVPFGLTALQHLQSGG